MSLIVYPKGSDDIVVSDKIAIFTESECEVSYLVGTVEDGKYVYQQTVIASQVVLTPGADVQKVRISAGSAATVYYVTGSDPVVSRKIVSQVASPATVGDSIQLMSVVTSTIADAAIVTVEEVRGKSLYQNATAGSVTCTLPSGTLLDAEFTDMVVGSAFALKYSSNDSLNTATIGAGVGITLVGTGTITQLGATFWLVKTGVATYDLVR